MIESAADFELWIADKPRADVVAVTTARAALRGLPLLDEDTPEADARADTPGQPLAGHGRQYRQDIVLPVFRAMATAWTLARYPDQLPDLRDFAERATDAVKSAYAGGIARYRSDGSYGTALPVLLIARYAAAIPFTHIPVRIAGELAMIACRLSSEEQMSALRFDVTLVEQGCVGDALIARPLWPDGLSHEHSRESWLRLRESLVGAGDDWTVWTDWYDARLAGRPVPNEALALAHVTATEALWKEPRLVNAELRRLIAAGLDGDAD
jgi:hypothetical protein